MDPMRFPTILPSNVRNFFSETLLRSLPDANHNLLLDMSAMVALTELVRQLKVCARWPRPAQAQAPTPCPGSVHFRSPAMRVFWLFVIRIDSSISGLSL